MKVDEIRESYLEFFEKKKHKRIPSDSLIPQNDPTLLFTGAGMNQFKDYFLGIKTELKRAASSQKCLRTGDLEEVGRTPFHHSFFEMLGNFSFGDYFKEEAILWAWEYLTQVLKINPNRLRVSVYKSDKEAFGIWKNTIKIRENWIYKLGDKSNFWPSNAPEDGPDGPCGPCSEIYFDQDPSSKSEDIENSRFAEIWNLVFTQYNRKGKANLVELSQKNIDTGMGLERLACVLQEKKTNYEIDTFEPILDEIGSMIMSHKRAEPNRIRSQYAIADHARAVVFAIHDGVIPSNEGRGYVIRKLIRRALWRAKQLKPEHEVPAFLYKLVPVIVEVMKRPYPELSDSTDSITAMLKGEEERFLHTLSSGLQMLEMKMKESDAKKRKKLSGEVVFELYDTYGFPAELTRYIAEEQGIQINEKAFEELMEAQRKRAKDATRIASEIFVTSESEAAIAKLPKSKFLGYDTLSAEGKIIYAQVRDGQGVVILDQTPFYGECGGQVGDKGTLKNKSLEAEVMDAQKKDDRILHMIKLRKGTLKAGDKVTAQVDQNNRDRIMRNHTATHLLHAALRKILGGQVRQLGSLVHPDKLRFDYSYAKPLTAEQIREIEDSVNVEILKCVDVTKEEKPTDQAKKEGAIAFFGEKYGDKVRVVTVPGYSKEFCGGTHCRSTGQIGAFVITSDSSIASGTRRIEALTGEGALAHLRQMRGQVSQLAQALKTTPDQLAQRVTKLQTDYKKLEKTVKQGDSGSNRVDAKEILQNAKPVGSLRLATFIIPKASIHQLRSLSDSLKSQGRKTVYLIAAEGEEKIDILLGASHDLKDSSLDLRELFKQISSKMGVSGGGRKDLVQAGAPNQGQLQKIESIEASAADYLKTVR